MILGKKYLHFGIFCREHPLLGSNIYVSVRASLSTLHGSSYEFRGVAAVAWQSFSLLFEARLQLYLVVRSLLLHYH